MTLHVCPDCQTRRSSVGIHRQDLKVAARKLARSDEPKYRRAVASAKAALAESIENLEMHEAECTFVPDAPPRIRGTLGQRQNNPPKPKPVTMTRAEKRAARVPDRSVLEAAIAEQAPVSLTKGRRIR